MYHGRLRKSDDGSVEKLDMFFGEAGAGYFSLFGTEQSRWFQMYGGLGYGRTNNKIGRTDQTNPEANARYFNVFVQPGIKRFYVNSDFNGEKRYFHLCLGSMPSPWPVHAGSSVRAATRSAMPGYWR